MNQSERKGNACNGRQARENMCGESRVGLVLLYFWLAEKMARVFNQSLSEVKQNKSKHNTN